MLKRATFVFFMALLAVSLTYAGDQTVTEVKTVEVKGTIDKIDLEGKTITVAVDGSPKVYTFTEKTTFGTPDKVFKVDELKAGESIILMVDDQNNITGVTRVEIQRQ